MATFAEKKDETGCDATNGPDCEDMYGFSCSSGKCACPSPKETRTAHYIPDSTMEQMTVDICTDTAGQWLSTQNWNVYCLFYHTTKTSSKF